MIIDFDDCEYSKPKKDCVIDNQITLDSEYIRRKGKLLLRRFVLLDRQEDT